MLSVISVVAAVLLVAYIVRQITHSGIELYENGFILKKALSQRVFMRDDIKVIYWDRPGQFAGTTRTVVRKTNGFAEVTLTSGEVVKYLTQLTRSSPTSLDNGRQSKRFLLSTSFPSAVQIHNKLKTNTKLWCWSYQLVGYIERVVIKSTPVPQAFSTTISPALTGSEDDIIEGLYYIKNHLLGTERLSLLGISGVQPLLYKR